MISLKWLLIIVLIGYGGIVGLLYVTQRSLQYLPERFRTTPAEAGLPQAEEITLKTPDGERVIVWYVPPKDDKPVVLYFHGNGGALEQRVDRFRAIIVDGTGLVALSYRGYGGSTGTPTEAGLITDAETAYDFAAARFPPQRIVLWGESLGTGVAVALAAEKPVGRVILQSPFTSTVDIGAARYWYVPVRLLMKDQFRSDLRIGKVTAPVLVMHGEADQVVPIALGERLYGMIKAPKRFVRFPGAGHLDLSAHGANEVAREFIAGRPPAD
jgi:fermentation-respiration switch protein FrsA (DUF1100 family)